MPRLTAQELTSRSKGLGSTDIVEANGLSPWRGAGPMRLYCEKLGIKSPNDEEEADDDRDHLEWGHVMEPVIAANYEEKVGVELVMGRRVTNKRWPHFWATLDRMVAVQEKLVEIKNVGSPALYQHWDVTSQDGIPRYVRAQVTVAMAISGYQVCDVAASIGGRPPHVWTVFYDAELGEMLMSGAVKFWDHVLTNVPPPIDGTPASKAYLEYRYPCEADRVIEDATEEEEWLANERAAAKSAEEEAKDRKANLDNMLLRLIGNRAGIKGNGWKMTWRTGKDGQRRQRFTSRGAE